MGENALRLDFDFSSIFRSLSRPGGDPAAWLQGHCGDPATPLRGRFRGAVWTVPRRSQRRGAEAQRRGADSAKGPRGGVGTLPQATVSLRGHCRRNAEAMPRLCRGLAAAVVPPSFQSWDSSSDMSLDTTDGFSP